MEVIRRRSQFQLEKASSRLSIVDGLLKALENVEAVVKLLRRSAGLSDARQRLSDHFGLSEDQSTAIASMPLSRLTSNEVQKLQEERADLEKRTSQLQSLLASPAKILKEVQNEAAHVVKRFGDGRRSVLVDDEGDLTDEDVIPNDPMIITFSQKGYVKRMLPEAFSVQKRGGKGVHGAKMRVDDAMHEILHVLAHDSVLFFSSDGRVFSLKAYQIPQSTRAATGSPITQVIPGLKTARITSIFTLGDHVRPSQSHRSCLRGACRRRPAIGTWCWGPRMD